MPAPSARSVEPPSRQTELSFRLAEKWVGSSDRPRGEKALQTVALKCYTGRMETTISQRELRNDSGAIMRRVEQGERFTVTRNGVPVADLVPHDRAAADRRRRFVPVAEVAAGVRRLQNWDGERFAAEQHQLDAAIDDSDAEHWGTAR